VDITTAAGGVLSGVVHILNLHNQVAVRIGTSAIGAATGFITLTVIDAWD